VLRTLIHTQTRNRPACRRNRTPRGSYPVYQSPAPPFLSRLRFSGWETRREGAIRGEFRQKRGPQTARWRRTRTEPVAAHGPPDAGVYTPRSSLQWLALCWSACVRGAA